LSIQKRRQHPDARGFSNQFCNACNRSDIHHPFLPEFPTSILRRPWNHCCAPPATLRGDANLVTKRRRIMQVVRFGVLLLLAASSLLVRAADTVAAPALTIVGYLRDSGCVHRFHEVVKPLPNGCLQACVRAGSPLVLLTKEEQVYHPIS